MCMKSFKIITVLSALMIISACLSQPHPVKNQYALRAEAPEASDKTRTDRRTLMVGTVSAAAGFDNRGLVYRVGPERFEYDFYNEFMAPPARLLADQTSQYLDLVSPRFRVVKSPGLTLAQYGLETYLEGLYGDYTVNPPQAVLIIRYTLNDMRGSSSRVVWDKTYQRAAIMNDKTPDALTEALGVALSDILNELNQDIGKAR